MSVSNTHLLVNRNVAPPNPPVIPQVVVGVVIINSKSDFGYPAQKGTRPAMSRAGRRLRDARINYGLTLVFVLALCLAYQLFAGQVGFHGVFPYRSVFSKVKTVQMQPVAWNNMENTTRKAGPVVLWKPGEKFVYFQPQTRDGPPQF